MRPLEDDRADERREAIGGRAGRGRRRGQPEPQRRNRHLQRLVAPPLTEVVGLIDDQQAELVAQGRHVAVGAGVGRDGHRRRVIALAVAEPADRAVPDRRQRGGPLVAERARRRQAERRRAGRRDGRRARAGSCRCPVGNTTTPRRPGLPPGRERRLLIRAQLERTKSGRRRERSAAACPRAGRPGAAAPRRAGSRAARAPGARRRVRPTERRGYAPTSSAAGRSARSASSSVPRSKVRRTRRWSAKPRARSRAGDPSVDS